MSSKYYKVRPHKFNFLFCGPIQIKNDQVIQVLKEMVSLYSKALTLEKPERGEATGCRQ